MNTFNTNNFKKTLQYTIIGDALGSPFDGLSKGHIKTYFKTIDDFCDTTPALKNKIDQWKKPGLYSALSQIIMLLAFTNFNFRTFSTIITQYHNYFSVEDDDIDTILRYPNKSDLHFIHGILTQQHSGHTICTAKCLPLFSLLALKSKSSQSTYQQILSWVPWYTLSLETIGGTLILSGLLYKLNQNPAITTSLIKITQSVIEETAEFIRENPSLVFNNKINPDLLLDSVLQFKLILEKIASLTEKDKAEQEIYSIVNQQMKSPLTRATVDHPYTILPYTIFLMDYFNNQPEHTILNIAKEGGNTTNMCAIAGALLTVQNNDIELPHNLTENLVNKKKINTYLDIITSEKNLNASIEEFLKGEKALTNKYISELKAKLKHAPKKKTKPKQKKHKEHELTQHVVNSWTKLDKAKWKKERKKLNNV